MTNSLLFRKRCSHHAAVWLLSMGVIIFPYSLQAHVGVHEEIAQLSGNIQQDPANPLLYLQRGELYRGHRSWGQALADFNKARKLGADEAAVETGLGRVFSGQGLHRQAIVHLNNALGLRPGSVRALVVRAESRMALGEPLAAAADYSRAIDYFQPPAKAIPEYYLQRARAYAAAGARYIDQALQGLDEGLRVLGSIRIIELYAVELEHTRGNLDAALLRLDSIIAGANRREFLLAERGAMLLSAGRIEEARQDYLAALAAIDVLPPSRRHTQSVRALRNDIDVRLKTIGTMAGNGN